MSGKRSFDDICGQLAVGVIIPLTEVQWNRLADKFTAVENINTGMGGLIQLVKRPVPGEKKMAWAIVEEPKRKARVIRPLKSEKEARALIADRLAAYERMWDG